METHILMMEDYHKWNKIVFPKWILPKHCDKPKIYPVKGFYLPDFFNNIKNGSFNSNCLCENNTKDIIKTIDNIPNNSIIIMCCGFSDSFHNQLLPTINKNKQILVSSSLNIIPYLKFNKENGRILILSYDFELMKRYIYNKKIGVERIGKKYGNIIDIIGYDEIDKDYKRMINDTSYETKKLKKILDDMLSMIYDKIISYIEENNLIEHVIIESTTGYDIIVPKLQDKLKDKCIGVYGLKETIEIIIENKII